MKCFLLSYGYVMRLELHTDKRNIALREVNSKRLCDKRQGCIEAEDIENDCRIVSSCSNIWFVSIMSFSQKNRNTVYSFVCSYSILCVNKSWKGCQSFTKEWEINYSFIFSNHFIPIFCTTDLLQQAV